MKRPHQKLLALLFGLTATALISGSALAQPTLPVGDPKSVGMSAERLAVLDAGIQAEITKGNVAGVVVAVTRHGRLVHNKAYGYADLAARDVEKHVFQRAPAITRISEDGPSSGAGDCEPRSVPTGPRPQSPRRHAPSRSE